VREAAAAVEDGPPEPRLVAYWVPGGEAAPGPMELRRRLAERLPAHMVPALFVQLDALPRTPNGKVDRRALPGVEKVRPELEQAFVPLRSEIERRIAVVWQEVLGIDTIGAHDNFFDLGGNSLLLAKMRARLHTTTGVDIPTVELFRHPTVAMLARFLVGGHAPVPARSDGRDQHTEDRRRAFAERARRIRDQPSKTGWA
jgi:acyl carrier protein